MKTLSDLEKASSDLKGLKFHVKYFRKIMFVLSLINMVALIFVSFMMDLEPERKILGYITMIFFMFIFIMLDKFVLVPNRNRHLIEIEELEERISRNF